VKLCHVIGIWLIFNASPKFRGLSSKIMRAKTCKIWGDFTQLPTLSTTNVNLSRFCSSRFWRSRFCRSRFCRVTVVARWLSKMNPSTSSSALSRIDRQRESEVELTPIVAIVIVVLVCAVLLGLYFLYHYLGTVAGCWFLLIVDQN